ncbi:MAG: magnesium protoporphyrin IX methyltransferase [Cyanobacteria bacterium]|nr:magnesium protoporphyrin IX methyltransferase [Cyanobacteriota bacterium]MDW8202381.1 magnesium protoporphyrin IX methyltransferase [Cyanobacteriota bacterium SKYGB_h_bin112]
MAALDEQTSDKTTLDDKTIVRDYFNTTGFDRWRRIYGDGEVNAVQADIRVGHQQTIDTVLAWLQADGNLSGLSICDAGCGVGSLSIPLAQLGATVYASDISEQMVGEARNRALTTLGQTDNPHFSVSDLEAISGQYHTVICLDVLIHYPQEKAAEMIAHLSSLASDRLILSFAPKTWAYTILKKIGDFFPGPSKATRAYLHAEVDVVGILETNGWTVKRNAMTKTRFYFSRLLEAVR